MRTAIDSSVLLSIVNDEEDADDWLGLLMQVRREGQLVVCEVVYAELSPAFDTQDQLDDVLRKVGVSFDFVSPCGAWHAGLVFRSYREAGGPREHLIPDFLIAAHAQTQADRLAARDRGYFRQYFPGLVIIRPE